MLIRATKTGTTKDGSPRMTHRRSRTHGMVNRSNTWPCRRHRHVLPVRITQPFMFARQRHLMLSKPRSIKTWDYHHRQGMYAKSVVWPSIDAVQGGMKPAW